MITIVSIAMLVVIFSLQVQLSEAAVTNYRNREQVISDFLLLEQTHPDLMTHDIVGQTVQGNDIYLFKIGNSTGGVVYVDAAMHGNEPVGTEAIYWVTSWLLSESDEDASRILANNYVLVMPVVNYDKYQLGRTNINNIDINRNFPYGWGKYNDANRGAYPLSEPEAQAVHSVITSYHPTWYLNLHCGDYRISPPWASQPYVPEQAYFREIRDKIIVESAERDKTSIPYKESSGIGGTARDEGYSNGAYSFVVELTTSYSPTYSTIPSTIAPKLTSVLVVVCRESEVGQQEPETSSMHINSITMRKWGTSRTKYCEAKVEVIDSKGIYVSGAAVHATWSWNSETKQVSAITDATGKAIFQLSVRSQRTLTFRFSVTNIAKNGWTYDAASNLVSGGTI